jgi:hypothetical protein
MLHTSFVGCDVAEDAAETGTAAAVVAVDAGAVENIELN